MQQPLVIPTEKEGIILRELASATDDVAYYEAYDASRDEIAEVDPDGAKKYISIDEVRKARLQPKDPAKLRFGIWDSHTFVGSINLTPDEQGAEIGYWRDSRYKHHGYTTIATRALADYAAQRYPKVHANVVEGNDASVRVLERAGFRQVAQEAGKLIFELAGSSGQHLEAPDK